MNGISLRALLLTVLVFSLNAPAQERSGSHTIQVTVVGPDGKPLADAPVNAIFASDFRSEEVRRAFSGTTDAQGRFQFQSSGAPRLRIFAKGVGFCTLGPLELKENRTVEATTPRLARFGRVEGSVDKSMLATCRDVTYTSAEWYEVRTQCDDQGRFILEDVIPEEHYIHLQPGTEWAKWVAVKCVVVRPGQTLSGVVLERRQPSAKESRDWVPMGNSSSGEPQAPLRPAEKPSPTRATGTVTDESGSPQEGVDVWGIVQWSGAIRMGEDAATAKTDAKGQFVIKGPVRDTIGGVILLAYKPGRVLAFAHVPYGRTGAQLILSSRAASLDVTVLQDGKPLPAASVSADMQHSPDSRAWARSEEGREHLQTIYGLLHPVAQTDANGIAHFTNLIPGLYQIKAVGSSKSDDLSQVPAHFPKEKPLAYGQIHGVAAAAGETPTYTIPVYVHDLSIPVQAVKPDGTPPRDQHLGLECLLNGSYAYSTAIEVKATGQGPYLFEQAGLWRLTTRFTDSAEQRQTSGGPFYQATRTVAVSTSFPRRQPVRIVGELHTTGVLEVQLQDAEGKPAIGTVVQPGFMPDDPPDLAATTDAAGLVRFEGLLAGTYRLLGYLDRDRPVPDLGKDSDPFPDDSTLTGISMMAREQFELKQGEHRRVVLREKQVGYLRGFVKVPRDHKPQQYYLWSFYTEVPMQQRYNPDTGEFLMGPLLPGEATFELRRRTGVAGRHGQEETEDAGRPKVQVVAGQVTHGNLIAQEPPPKREQPAAQLLGMGGISTISAAKPVAQRVLLADGKTPAFGALAAFCSPGRRSADWIALADGAGRLHARGVWSYGSQDQSQPPPPGSPAGPVLVAWLPGSCGATIVAITDGKLPEQPIVLPAPVSLTGRITVGGRPASGLKADLRVYAAYEGKGCLNELLSIDVSPAADGSFEIRGITPGTYRIQAAMDASGSHR